MEIDIEKLATNRAYWLMVAPEGAECYFYRTESPFFTPFFAKSATYSDFSLGDISGGWEGEKVSGERYHVFSECWAKVDKPAESTWEDIWERAPSRATHLDTGHGFFCDQWGFWTPEGDYITLHDGHYEWGTDRYIPRPEPVKSPEEPSPLFYQAIGWAHAQCCVWLDEGKDPREQDIGQLADMADRDFGFKTKEQKERDELALIIWSGSGMDKDNAYRIADDILSWLTVEEK